MQKCDVIVSVEWAEKLFKQYHSTCYVQVSQHCITVYGVGGELLGDAPIEGKGITYVDFKSLWKLCCYDRECFGGEMV